MCPPTHWLLLALASAWLLGAGSAPPKQTWEHWAARQVGTDAKLLTAICGKETETERTLGTEDRAIGDGGESIGRCQVKVTTAAMHMGLRADQLTPQVRAVIKRILHDPALGTYYAARELNWCLRHRRTKAGAVYCYRAGRQAKWRGITDGVAAVLKDYRALD